MRAVDVIRAKRDGAELDDAAIRGFVSQACAGDADEGQITAFLMAVFFRGMTARETSALTLAMRDSGEVVRFGDLGSIPVDKHSTGGVGDKVSLALAPLVAACGAYVPMIAGRGLGHTGGTLDKLEAIPGFRVSLSLDRFREIVRTVGACIIGQTETLCPADRKFYALRDVTATVESIPLIVASILSKKSAAGIGALVMDVKCGSGAFMTTEEDADALARALMRTAGEMGLPLVSLITDMSQPLGRAVGNAVEVREAIDCLRGEGPEDLREETLVLGAHMLVQAGVNSDLPAARLRAERAISDASAQERFGRMIEAQGGDARVIEDPGCLPVAAHEKAVRATRSGFVARIDTAKIGVAAMRLGAGRERAGDRIDPAVGIRIEKKLGDAVRAGEALATLFYNEDARVAPAATLVEAAYAIGEEPVAPPPLIKRIVEADARH